MAYLLGNETHQGDRRLCSSLLHKSRNDKTSDALYNFVQTLLAQIKGTKGGPRLELVLSMVTPLSSLHPAWWSSADRRVLRGNCFQMGQCFRHSGWDRSQPPHCDVGELGVGNMKKPSQLIPVVADWFKRMRNPGLPAWGGRYPERSSSSTFCVSPVTRPLYFQFVSTYGRRNRRCTDSGTGDRIHPRTPKWFYRASSSEWLG